MKNPERWAPTKFVWTRRGYRPSPDPRQVGRGSRLIGTLQIQFLEPLLREHARGVLLDLGCGYAPYYGIYKDQVQDTVCVDWEQSLHANPLLDLYADLNAPLPLSDSTFDTVLLTDVLEHISEPQQLMEEVARVMKEGGKLLLTVPFFYHLHEQPHDYYRYTEFALRRFCERAGLEVLSLRPYGGAPEVLLDIVAKHLGFSRVLSAMHLGVSRLLLSSRIVKWVSRAKASAFPMGYILVARKGRLKTISPASNGGGRPIVG